ncbi:MAG: carbamoyl phosphate synthase small subunit [Firmicutes bacterium]|nr:carbamoyl phosphate synthase small subunit [Bacillota bacterium]
MKEVNQKNAYLVLSNGKVFKGQSFGHDEEIIGEVVFTTAMSGYLETLTDPSYFGQIVTMTFPLVGNYGVIQEDFESGQVWPRGFIVKYPCKNPSNFRSQGDLDTLLKKHKVTGICNFDIRALTKILRNEGAMGGKILFREPTKADIEEAKKFKILNAISNVSMKDTHQGTCQDEGVNVGVSNANPNKIDNNNAGAANNGRQVAAPITPQLKVALLDTGTKRAIMRLLTERGCEVKKFPFNATAEEILAFKPDGIMLSPGPGDPSEKANEIIIKTVEKLSKSGVPIFGICMGHLLLATANGLKTRKLKFGHRSSNQPVKDLSNGKVYITSQNHGYEVVCKNPWLVNVNDNSCEGIDYGKSFSVQFHPEAHSGPHDTMFLFDKFVERMKK